MSMAMMEWLLEAALVAGIIAALPPALRLERALSGLSKDKSAVMDSVRGFTEATKQAEASIGRLRATADSASRSVAEQVAAATALRDDLRFLTERAGVAADRLDTGLRGGGRPPVPEAANVSPIPRARAEQELLRAISRSRSA
ncbi:hypothetical protein G3576_17055 [Roseomonas stagni]|uniref:DUF6468 domain-containing protein n=1 Tax=Falsiroseomonas algicola TaxID=2716930 RepID=A0A6M1LMZ5_9PROT|nr:DUF6468 domain-containing protein [Falsiroseomonas algicola]NGM21735.1 hypothetical protein [Falsiroseomonas algicola]